jgi:homoserine kinase
VSEVIEFSVPGTCAHLGPGFGVLGVAVDIPLRIRVESKAAGGHRVVREGSLSHAPKDPRHDPILRAVHAAAERFAIRLPAGLDITATNDIPAYTGLGTNAASFAAGFGIAARFAPHTPPADELIDLLVELGGTAAHGGAALYGGLVACCEVRTAERSVGHHVFRYALAPEWHFVLVCPHVRIGAAEANRILPPTLAHGVVQRSSGRLLGLLHGFAVGDEVLLGNCIADEIHVPFRRALVPGLGNALEAIVASGVPAVTISGAGPTLVAITRDEAAGKRAAQAARAAFAAAGVDVHTLQVRGYESGALPGDA